MENIIFGEAYDPEWFTKVVKLCQLEADIETLPAGIYTEIGEKGINLSGGQKQRIQLARAVYSNSEIYLIDDALSSLDAQVSKKVYEDVIYGVL